MEKEGILLVASDKVPDRINLRIYLNLQFEGTDGGTH